MARLRWYMRTHTIITTLITYPGPYDTFRVWHEKEVKHLGEYRTKRVILEIYDEMQLAIESGEAYRTRLDPPPADAAVAHEPRDYVRDDGARRDDAPRAG